MRTILLLLVLFSCVLVAQPPLLFLDLSGEWRFQQADSPEFARPDFDDRAWETRQLPWLQLRPQETWWLRRTVTIPEWADLSSIVLTLGGMNEVYEVFVNETRIAVVGGHTIWQERVTRPRSFAVPAGLVPASNRRLTVALRL